MLNFVKIYAIWYREIKRTLNSRMRLIASLGMPLFMLLSLGIGIGSLVKGFNYQSFILPGIIAQVLLFNSIFSGVTVIWDRQFGFLREILVSPTNRIDIILGRMLGGATRAVLQGFLILIIGTIFSISPILSIFDYLLLIFLMFIISCSFVGFGVGIASIVDEIETFQPIMNFIIMPLFFLSNSLFPADRIPGWLRIIVTLNPLTYATDGLRSIILKSSTNSLIFDFVVCFTFFILILFTSANLFKKAKI